MFNPYQFPYQSPYQQRLAAMENQMQVPTQPIQTIQKQAPQSQCFFVSDKTEMDSLQPAYNTVYIGINKKAKEIYLRTLNNDGLIELETYSMTDGKQEQTELKSIMDKLTNIEKSLAGGMNERNTTNVDAATNVGSTAE